MLRSFTRLGQRSMVAAVPSKVFTAASSNFTASHVRRLHPLFLARLAFLNIFSPRCLHIKRNISLQLHFFYNDRLFSILLVLLQRRLIKSMSRAKTRPERAMLVRILSIFSKSIESHSVTLFSAIFISPVPHLSDLLFSCSHRR